MQEPAASTEVFVGVDIAKGATTPALDIAGAEVLAQRAQRRGGDRAPDRRRRCARHGRFGDLGASLLLETAAQREVHVTGLAMRLRRGGQDRHSQPSTTPTPAPTAW